MPLVSAGVWIDAYDDARVARRLRRSSDNTPDAPPPVVFDYPLYDDSRPPRRPPRRAQVGVEWFPFPDLSSPYLCVLWAAEQPRRRGPRPPSPRTNEEFVGVGLDNSTMQAAWRVDETPPPRRRGPRPPAESTSLIIDSHGYFVAQSLLDEPEVRRWPRPRLAPPLGPDAPLVILDNNQFVSTWGTTEQRRRTPSRQRPAEQPDSFLAAWQAQSLTIFCDEHPRRRAPSRQRPAELAVFLAAVQAQSLTIFGDEHPRRMAPARRSPEDGQESAWISAGVLGLPSVIVSGPYWVSAQQIYTAGATAGQVGGG